MRNSEGKAKASEGEKESELTKVRGECLGDRRRHRPRRGTLRGTLRKASEIDQVCAEGGPSGRGPEIPLKSLLFARFLKLEKYFHLRLGFLCSSILSTCPALYVKFPPAKAELSRQWNTKIPSLPNPGQRSDEPPCTIIGLLWSFVQIGKG